MIRRISSGLNKRSQKGFTLVELAIVLGVSSLLLTGLWRLMSSGNTRTRDQVAAEQHRQIVTATQAYLETTEGQTKLGALAANSSDVLPIPVGTWNNVPSCRTLPNMSATKGYCEYLPLGFNSTTTNSYNQVYVVRIRKDDSTPAGTVPKNYSFAIITTGGQTIPDTSGSRIASLIGRDGGFYYAQSVCGAGNLCGSYGTWTVDPSANYGQAMTAGHVGSVTYRGGNIASESFWLARKDVPGDAAIPNHLDDLNTVQTNLSLGGNTLFGKTASGAGSLYASRITNMRQIIAGSDDLASTDAPMKVLGACKSTDIGARGCAYGLEVHGDVSVQGLLVANLLYAGQFIYQTSSSDNRLKTEIKPIEKALDAFSKAKGYSFTMKDTGEKRYGVIAQEIETYFPEIVHKDLEGMMSVDYMGLIGPLVAAVGELKSENDALRADVEALKKQVSKPARTGKK